MAENLILDSGVIVKWVIREHDTDLAVAIYDRFQAGEFKVLIPDLVFAEFGNILWKKRIFENLPDVEAEAAIAIFKEIPFIITPSQSLFDSAMSLSIKYKRTFYDSLYLALSLKENSRFVTADARLFNAVSAALPNITLLSDWQE